MGKQSKSSWENSAKWYDSKVGQEGHHYHKHVILPNLLPLMELTYSSRVLDLACGQGFLSRALPKNLHYSGADVSKSLIQAAKQRSKNPNHHFFVRDATKVWSLKQKPFTHATIILALQNLGNPLQALKTCADHLEPSGKLFVVLNHPCFRIPRQSHWEIDEGKKLQYRRVDTYLSSLDIPIRMHPGKKDSEETISFHHSLSTYMTFLKEAGFLLSDLKEWTSDKKSTGKNAKMENRARKEIPLFLTLCGIKKN